MSHIERHTAHAKARYILAIVLSLVLGVLSLGVTAPANAAAPESKTDAYVCIWHKVRAGDTLNELAARYGTTALAIRRANGLKSTRIYTGTTLCIPRNVQPKPPAPPPPSASGPWYGEYWNNTNQSGPAALVRNDAAINFDWGYGSPDLSRIQPDYFSARWTRNINFSEGVWRFGVQVDDGVRITVDNQVIMDFFNHVGPQQRTVDIPLSAGQHRVTVDYVEQTGLAYIKFNTQRIGSCPVYGGVGCPPPPCQPGQYNCPLPPPDNAKFNNGPWQTDYFANPFFTPPPFASRVEPGMRFDWRGAPPVPGMPGTFWTARFAQVRYFPQGVYQFVARVDDGIRIYVDGTLIMDQFREQSTRTFTSEVNFGAGNHTIVVEYVQYGGTSDLSLYWDFLGDPNAPAVRQMVANPAAIPYFPGK